MVIGSLLITNDVKYISNERSNSKKITKTMLFILILSIFAKYLSSNFELANSLLNPKLFTKGDVFETLIYKAGLLGSDYGIAQSIWFVKNISEFVTSTISIFLLFIIFRAIKPKISDSILKESNDNIFIVLCSIFSLIILELMIITIIPNKPIDTNVLRNINYTYNIIILISFIIVSIVSSVITSILSFPLISKKALIYIIYLLFILPVLYLNNYIMEFLIIKNFGLLNTIIPVIFTGFIPIWMLVINGIYINRPQSNDITCLKDYIKSITPLTIILTGIQFSFSWGGYRVSFMYTNNRNFATIPMMIQRERESFALNLIVLIPIIIIWAGIGIYLINRNKDSIKK